MGSNLLFSTLHGICQMVRIPVLYRGHSPTMRYKFYPLEWTIVDNLHIKVRGLPGFDSVTLTFPENSNRGGENCQA